MLGKLEAGVSPRRTHHGQGKYKHGGICSTWPCISRRPEGWPLDYGEYSCQTLTSKFSTRSGSFCAMQENKGGVSIHLRPQEREKSAEKGAKRERERGDTHSVEPLPALKAVAEDEHFLPQWGGGRCCCCRLCRLERIDARGYCRFFPRVGALSLGLRDGTANSLWCPHRSLSLLFPPRLGIDPGSFRTPDLREGAVEDDARDGLEARDEVLDGLVGSLF